MKIPLRAFLFSLFLSFIASSASYFLLKFLCVKFAPFLINFVFLISIVISIILCYLCAVHYKVFKGILKKEKLTINKGFIIKRKKHVNLRFAVSVKSVSTPLMRMLKLSNILIMFEGSVCFLPLIKADDAELISKRILKLCEKNEKI